MQTSIYVQKVTVLRPLFDDVLQCSAEQPNRKFFGNFMMVFICVSVYNNRLNEFSEKNETVLRNFQMNDT